MKLLLTANKTKLIKFLRAKGYNIPSSRQAHFEHDQRNGWFELCWHDKDIVCHQVRYFEAFGEPMLLVDTAYIDLTMAEVIQFGLAEEK